NNRQDIFESEADLIRIKEDLKFALEKSGCQLHAYVMMTNHLHLLITPETKEQLTVFMQAMANKYVRYFNATRSRTGTIWEGRYKSCLVDSDQYLFTLYKYIELNPIKASRLISLNDYPWPSYHHNALGVEDEWISEHSLYLVLGEDVKSRCERYQALFDELELAKQNDRITQATLRAEVYGSDRFHQQIDKLISRPTVLSTHGGDRKSAEYKNQVG
ncbi:MAG: transposase, partial [Methyloprofundus sp.]|nr:transposase [Methyloprofundus sp.]